jgi:very-short-patch-repair endonuclease
MRFNEHPNTDRDVKRARYLRNAQTPFERKLWALLREGGKQKNLRFRRQQPIHPFIADFACMEARLLIELDGFSHDLQLDYDRTRDKRLRQMGFTILRYANDDVKNNVYGVVETILIHAENLVKRNRDSDFAGRPPP